MTVNERERIKREKELRKKFKNSETMVSLLAMMYPMSAEREYRRVLNRYSSELIKIADELERNLRRGRNKKWAIEVAVGKVSTLSAMINTRCEISRIARLVCDACDKRFDQVIKKTIGETLPSRGDIYEKERRLWSEENILLFALLTDQLLDSFQVIKKENDTDKIKKVFDDIRDRIGKFDGNSVADNVGNLYADATMKIYKWAGIDSYIWKTKRDSKVRECHKELDGKKIRIDDPPEMWYGTKNGKVYTGHFCHPGQDYNCRCHSIPVINLKTILRLLGLSD